MKTATDPRLRRHPLGFLEVIDRPTPNDLGAYYADAYYQAGQGSFRRSYPDEELHVIRLRVQQRAVRAIALLGHDRPGRLLDVGCGEGFVLAEFARRGWDVAGMDFSISGVETMNPDMADRVTQGDVFDLLDAAIASGRTYDLIWLGNVLEHVLDPIGLLGALRRLVGTGAGAAGVLVATVPNDGSAYQEALLETGAVDRRFWIAIPDHLSYFTADTLRSVARATGWNTLDILGDFPIDLFLAHPGSNYVVDASLGRDAHVARLRLETVIGAVGVEAANRFYSALAAVGLGRNLTAFLRPAEQGNQT